MTKYYQRNMYSLEHAHKDMLEVREHCGYADPTAAVAFAIIVKRLTQGVSAEDFARRPQLMAFVFTGLFELRDWVFNSAYEPSADGARTVFRAFDSDLRYRLMECNGDNNYGEPKDIDGRCLWALFFDDFIPVVEGIVRCGDAKTDLSFLRAHQA